MKFLKRLAIFAVLLAIVYASSVGIMKSNLHAANVVIHVAPSTLGKIAVGPRLADEIESCLLLDGVYTYQESDNIMHILCMVPYRFTNHWVANGKGGLSCSPAWKDGSYLVRGGIMRANDQFYLIDYLDKLDMEIDLYWERQEDLDEPIGLRGLILDITTAPDVKTYTEFEWWVCNGVCLFASQGANIYGAAAFFALFTTIILWTCCWLIGLLFKNIFKRTL